MKKIALKANSTLLAAVTTPIVAPKANVGHHITIVDANADSLEGSLGIDGDRAEELERDIIDACDVVIKVKKGARLTLVQVIAIASAHAQSDNELVLATAVISEAYARRDWKGLKSEIEKKLAETTGNSATIGGETSIEDNDDQGFAAFLKAMMNAQAGEGMLAGETDEDEDLKEQN